MYNPQRPLYPPLPPPAPPASGTAGKTARLRVSYTVQQSREAESRQRRFSHGQDIYWKRRGAADGRGRRERAGVAQTVFDRDTANSNPGTFRHPARCCSLTIAKAARKVFFFSFVGVNVFRQSMEVVLLWS